MIIEGLVVGYLDTNCYIVADENTNDAILIDPGGDEDQIMELIDARGFNVEYILLTHGHWDHVFGAQVVAKRTGAKVCIHGMDMFLLNDIRFVPPYMHDELPEENVTVDVELSDGQVLNAGLIEASIIHTPGHSPGSISVRIGDTIFTGDLLFKRAIGRTDLTGSSHEALINSVKEKIFVFPDDFKVYPGHGPSSTVGEERTGNPFLIK